MSVDTPTTTELDLEKGWTNPFQDGTPLYELYERRIKHNSDLVFVVSDWHNRRGTGKTVCSLKLAQGLDRTDEGITKQKASLSPEEIREAYSDTPKGSALILDEAEAGISNRSAMTNVNKAMRKIMSMGRVKQKYLVLNAPASSHIDKSVKELADVWILVQRKGQALVHFFEYQPYSNTALTPKKQLMEWDDIESGTQLKKVYNYLTKQKNKQIEGKDGSGYIEKEEHEEKMEKMKKKVRRERRNELIKSVSELPITNTDLADAVGLSQQHVGRIINEG